MNLGDLGSYASLASLPAAVITVWAWLQANGAARKIIITVFLPIAIAAYTIDIFDRFGWINLSARDGQIIMSWGAGKGTFQVVVGSYALLKYKDNFKMMLILNIPYANVDLMTDPAIVKSPIFTITGAPTAIGIPAFPPQLPLQVSIPSTMKIGDSFNLPMLYILVIIPKNNSTDLIKSLSDVEKIGGKIVEIVEKGNTYTITSDDGGNLSLRVRYLLAASLIWPAAAGAQTASPPLILEAKIPLGEVDGALIISASMRSGSGCSLPSSAITAWVWSIWRRARY
jgi:hypothetical protein